MQEMIKFPAKATETSEIALNSVRLYTKSALNPVQFHKIYVSLQHIHQLKNK